MLDYLIERDKEEGFRTASRMLDFPDGQTHRVTAYRLVWAWYDRMLAYEFGYDAPDILAYTQRCAEQENHDLGTALGVVLNHLCQAIEQEVGDITDDNIALTLAQRAGQNFTTRKNGRAAR